MLYYALRPVFRKKKNLNACALGRSVGEMIYRNMKQKKPVFTSCSLFSVYM